MTLRVSELTGTVDLTLLQIKFTKWTLTKTGPYKQLLVPLEKMAVFEPSRVLHHFRFLGQDFAQSIADRSLCSVQSQPKICAPSGPAERSKKPCSAEETTLYTDAGARWLYAWSFKLKQVACYHGYIVVDDWRNQRAYLPSKQQINHRTLFNRSGFPSFGALEVLPFWISMQSLAYFCRGANNKILADWSWNNLYSRDKLLNGYWFEPCMIYRRAKQIDHK